MEIGPWPMPTLHGSSARSALLAGSMGCPHKTVKQYSYSDSDACIREEGARATGTKPAIEARKNPASAQLREHRREAFDRSPINEGCVLTLFPFKFHLERELRKRAGIFRRAGE
eukprot:3177037-Rhodomonas_salina.3